MTLKWRQTLSGRQAEEMQFWEAMTAGCFCLVLIWCTWLPQSVNATSIGRLVTNVHGSHKHVDAHSGEVTSRGASYSQADYDYDEEENDDEEAKEELEAALSGATKFGGANVEAEGENNGNDDEEEAEEDYGEDDEDNGDEEGRAAKRKYLIEKFMGIKM